jgi:hypothetical protein
MRRILIAGGIAQAASASSLLAQNILAPVLMGAESYGQAVALVVLPFLSQGLLEPMVNGAAIAAEGRHERMEILRRSAKHLSICAPVIAVASLLYGVTRHASPVQSGLLVLFVGLVLINTGLRAIAFAGMRLRILAAHQLAALAATFFALPLLWLSDVSGYLAMLCLVQLAVLFVLLWDQDVRQTAKTLLRTNQQTGHATPPLGSVYLANLSPRVTQLSLGPGMLMLASFQLGAVQIAEFRILQTLSGAIGYALPVNAPLMQAIARRTSRSHGPSMGTPILIAAATTATATAGVALWVIYPLIVNHLLQLDAASTQFRWLAPFAPLYGLAPLLGGTLLGWGEKNFVLYFNAIMAPSVIALGLTAGVGIGFAAGCILFALGLGWATLRVNHHDLETR